MASETQHVAGARLLAISEAYLDFASHCRSSHVTYTTVKVLNLRKNFLGMAQIASEPCHRAQSRISGSHPQTSPLLRETRAVARARIAAAAPRTTYGKHKNKLLPLTGSQFKRSNQVDESDERPEPSPLRKRVPVAAQVLSDSEDSPLSDAEPHQQSRNPPSLAPGRRDSPTRHSKQWQAAQPIKRKTKPRSTSVGNGRLPLNQLILVTGSGSNAVTGKLPRQPKKAAVRDPISSAAQTLLDASISSGSDATPTKRKRNASLSAIRKRLRMSLPAYKSAEQLRKNHSVPKITASGSQALHAIGDGFDDTELTSRRERRVQKGNARRPRQHDYLFERMEALTLVSGPLPDVDFSSKTQGTLELKVEKDHEAIDNHEASSHSIAASDVIPPSRQPGSRCSRSVSFLDHDSHIVQAQLSSVSAPRREPSISLDTGEEDQDEGDDEAADTYVDEDDLQAADGASISDGDVRAASPSSSEHSPEPSTPPTARPFHVDRRNSFKQPQNHNSVALNFHRPAAPDARVPSISGKRLTMELNEPIMDDFEVNDLLLEDIGCIEHGDHIIERPPSPLKTDAVGHAQPRSILKNSTPHISSERNRPESTAANTRRNSMVKVHESRYFTSAKEHLDSIETSHPVVRKKSNSRYIEIPYSDDFVPETSPMKVDYSNAGQMHMLRRGSEAVWLSKVLPSRQTDLRQLTRMVSEENGTLSQAVRRRSSLSFRSPAVIRRG